MKTLGFTIIEKNIKLMKFLSNRCRVSLPTELLNRVSGKLGLEVVKSTLELTNMVISRQGIQLTEQRKRILIKFLKNISVLFSIN